MPDSSPMLTTRTGFRFRVRPATPADEAALAEFFTHVTHEDLRFRFLTGLNEVGHDRLAAMTTVDHHQTESFIAFDEGATLIATAMLACDAALDRGEVAISIRDDFKQRGVSWELLAYVARVAEAKGVKTLESIESRENHAAIELEREMGFTAEPYPDDSTLVLVRRTLAPAQA
ncbi:GNAT family N-acetyltransferase [Sphingomonas hengshuiensis]|uniref:GCN5 family acetyltransferase n=1 Tax=Sphingomonas hengshuiensis TaxID=1609977 RepID=A0A7U5BFI0_9SPHN|nr:GNAT family N-acetyltransferase [Sphingomonas hengshuiensis]AJP74331.1 GCN5 family acetyltransferase [Sphingomonas hengshuiensis]